MSTNPPTELSAAIARAKHKRAAKHFSPLAPYLPPADAELHPEQAALRDAALAEARAWEAELLAQVRRMRRYLHWSYAELCDEARRIPERLCELAAAGGVHEGERLVGLAERLFDITVKGETAQARVARVLDARFWRRILRENVAREKEMVHVRGGLVGKDGSAYCSEDTVRLRATQRKAQQQWLKETTLQAVIDGEEVELAMEAVAKTPHQRLSRLYAFIAAMDKLAVKGELAVALVTATLESEWHPNPARGKATHHWNGKTPKEASQELGERWGNIRRDLGKKRIMLSGLWAAEPHRDGCPHRHFWLIYAPEHQREVFAAFLAYFPGKLKVRGEDEHGARRDVVFETKADARDGVSRPLRSPRGKPEGAQVDVSVVDREKGSGASYVIKYVSKSIGAEGAFDGEDASPKTQRELRNLMAIDAYRALWGMRGAQFFGIRNCLTLWDELRGMKASPVQPELRALWRAARGGDAEGRIEATQQRGDACEFLRLQGGLAAQPKEPGEGRTRKAEPKARVYRSATLTQYGEEGARIEGVELVGPPEKKARRKKVAGEPKAPRTPRPREVLERVPTHLVRWSMKVKKDKPVTPKPKARAKTAPAEGGRG